MADSSQAPASPKDERGYPEAGEDAETRAARRELKQSSISDPPAAAGHLASRPVDDDAARPETPAEHASDSADERLKEQMPSPKKKRAHDQLDGSIDVEQNDANSVTSTESTRDRASRLEPEKKRHREEDSSRVVSVCDAPPFHATRSLSADTQPVTEDAADTKTSPAKPMPQTSSAAFSASGFGKLAAGSSPFASLSTAQSSIFSPSIGSSALSSTPSLGAPASQPASSASMPKLTFGSANSASPFASLSSGFGGATLGSPFSAGKSLSSFASPSARPLQSEKPAKPFGAPESDVDDEDDEDADRDGESESDEQERAASPEREPEEKKRFKLHKVEVDDGEAGEATLLSVRAKMFYHDKDAGWKERGGGMLKINVPEACIEFDETGAPIPGSFDASGLEAGEGDDTKAQGHKVVRLLMRQDQTHRVILNTAILPAMTFQEKASLKTVAIVFTAFEGEPAKPVSITMRDSSAEDPGVAKHSLVLAMDNNTETAPAGSELGRQDLRKRVHEEDPPGGEDGRQAIPTTVPEKRPRKKRRESSQKQHDQIDGSDSSVPSSIPWTDSLQALERAHRALNLVYTFCSTRKHVLTTFETLRPAVESHIKKELTVQDVAQMVALRPEALKFEYVNELMLQLNVRGAQRDDVFKSSQSSMSQTPAHDASVGGLTGNERLGDDANDKAAMNGRQVLYLEFIDGDLKRQVADKATGEATRPTQKLRKEKLKMPVYGQKQMTQLIERRNQKFANAINDFLSKCLVDSEDPDRVLLEKAQFFIPKLTVNDDVALRRTASTIPDVIPQERQSISEIVNLIKESSWYSGQIVPDGHRVFEPQSPAYGSLNFLLSQDLVNALYNAKRITQFYTHQAEALNRLHEGQNIVISTSTSSGKSLVYQLPVLHALEQDLESRALYIFPTKALAQDQKRSLRDILTYMPSLEHVLVETFDGDTPLNLRDAIREEARIIFTNPDMLHLTILPQEQRWRTFLKNLKFVVVDELHYYNGQLGSHVAFIMRRLRRICAAVGNRHVQFISCSATVANPEEHFKLIFGVSDVCLIDYDGSPSGRKEFLCWNTPFKEPGDPASGRGSAKFECARLFCALLLRGVRIIAFCRVRAQCEALTNAIKQELHELGRPECTNLVMGYRGGYTARDRRKIETEMFQGKLLGIVATTALELGIDIGSLDCVLTWGFPYTIANLRQQSGRAGRRTKDSLSILVGDSFPTDQHYMNNPDELFSKPNCELRVDLDDMLIREGHIQCAAYEMPIRQEEDMQFFGQDLPQICRERLVKDDAGFFHCHDRFRPNPAQYIAIRDAEDDHFAIIDITNGRNEVLEELEASRATFTIYDGAIFLHQGNTYLIRDFLPDQSMAKVERVNVEWTTMSRDFTDIDPVEIEAIRTISGSSCHAYYGGIKIQQNVFGFFKVDKKGRIIDAVQVDNPPVIRYSKGMWLDIPAQVLELLRDLQLNAAAAIHAAEHVIMSLLPAFVISLPGDVRTECKVALKEFAKKETKRKRPARLTFYDAKGGANGSGVSTKAFDHIDHLLERALKRVEECCCQQGCVECVASEICKESNEVISKTGCLVILRSLLGVDIRREDLQQGPEEIYLGVETIASATPIPLKR
ncbi:P-loop containing nucleoside triphosphate hydrolase protein [Trichoderma citrinoviride]|uniref:P-loop containing nucleoside triphosphate hydrolase protein n=1 Tax=Trichoderma citrinoviride TaxID=58853 RepID=A0A2T4BP22_9HYPO|nr:P-loop containing nucleoside triphosphate hydrolase protein [Trichoderma citrinoviride]PTB71041.1 P-loop containing nucleoside triphosphate hydrolase protein [Trichoderma citrinoviride]